MSLDFCSINKDNWLENEVEYLRALDNCGTWCSVPLVDVSILHNICDGQLVRFRCMVQDMHGPEIYLEKFQVLNAQSNEMLTRFSKYSDLLECNENETIQLEAPDIVRSERHVFVATQTPALNVWVTEMVNRTAINVSDETTKRKVDENKQPDEIVKRLRLETDNGCNSSDVNYTNACTNIVVKVYQDAEKIKLNSICEFIGFFFSDTSANTEAVPSDDNSIARQLKRPTIHCVRFKNDLEHCNPLLDSHLDPYANPIFNTNKMISLKRDVQILFTQLLLGDELAAEYLIYNLLSEIYLRSDMLPLGKFTLNISNVPSIECIDYVKDFYSFIELLVPKSKYLSMALENMNTMKFTPKKNYEDNTLSGNTLLQVSRNTHVICDETKLSVGQLNENGVRGLKALSHAIRNQRNSYDFVYYELEYDCDIAFVIFSEGKSILPSDIRIDLEVDAEHVATIKDIMIAAKHFLNPQLLNELRIYLTVARLGKYEIPDQLRTTIEQEFVSKRQERNGMLNTGDDLHAVLVLCRLICLSEGRAQLDEQCWKRACELHQRRIRRSRGK